MRTTLLAASAALTLFTSTATAQGWIERDGPVVMPAVPSAIIRVGTNVRISLDGRIARFEIEELFRNTGGRIAEGSYLYPLPGEAVFTDFSLFLGDQELKGEVMNAEQARGIYEEIVRRQRDPALLTLAGHGLVRAQVFPIQPGETRKVILRYTQVLPRDGDAYRIRYALGARGDGPVTVAATARGAARFGVPYSPTHELRWRVEGDRLTMRVDTQPRGDLEILLPLQQGLVGAQVLTHAPGGDDRFFMLVLSPPPVASDEVLARDLTLVVDVSGSMAGTKLEQAKAALHQALGSLRRQDRFRLLAFSSRVTQFRDGFSAVTREAVTDAQAFVEQLGATGGTNIAEALETALPRHVADGRMGILLFLTDGLPSVGEQSPEKLAADAAARRGATRIFSIGIGHDVNTYLLDRLAVEGRGRSEYVAPEADVETAVGAVLGRINAPALTDLRVVSSPVQFLETAPADLPDLYFGEELVLVGRYRGTGTGAVVVEGQRHGKRERFSARATFPEHDPDNDFIPPLWAARRVGELTRQIRLEGQSPILVTRIRELGLRYGILTEYTSYLVQEPGQTVANRAVEDRIAPAAQSGAAAFRRAERSAELSAAKSIGGVESAARQDAPEGKDPGRLESRRAGGRLFVRRAGIWTDAGYLDTLQVVTVAAFSPAYFDLARAIPELAGCLSVGDEVLVSGKRVGIRVGATGLSAWKTGELERLTQAFRGT